MRTRQYRISVLHNEAVEKNRRMRIQRRIEDLYDDHKSGTTILKYEIKHLCMMLVEMRRAYVNKVWQ